MRRVNVRFLLVLVGLVVLIGAGLPILHSFQTDRIASALLAQAQRQEEEGRPKEAAKFLSRYLEFVPQDVDTLVRLGNLREQLATTPRQHAGVLQIYEKVLRRDGQRTEVRRKAVTIAMDLGRYTDAIAHLQVLLEAAPADAALEQLLGQCQEASAQYAEAEQSFRSAVAHAPTQVQAAVSLADLLRRRLNKPRQADQVMDALVAANPRAADAYLARARYRRASNLGTTDLRPDYLTAFAAAPAAGFPGNLSWSGLVLSAPAHWPHSAGVANDVLRAYQLAPRQADVLLAMAELAQERKWAQAARDHLQLGCQLFPRDVRMYQSLAWLELSAEQPGEALTCLRRGLEAVSSSKEQTMLRWTLAEVLIQEGKQAEAEQAIALLRKSDYAAANIDYLNARLLARNRQWSEAARALERLRSQPEVSPYVARRTEELLGQCFEQLEEPDRQLDACQRVLANDPGAVLARYGKASALATLGKIPEAIVEFEQLMALPEAPVTGWTALARLLVLKNSRLPVEERDWQTVEAVLARVQASPVEMAVLRAQALMGQDRLDEARTLLEDQRREHPEQVELWTTLATVRERQTKKPAEALAVLDEARTKAGDRVELRLARARYEVKGLEPKQAATVLDRLAQGVDAFSPPDRLRLLRGLADAHFQAGDVAAAQRCWSQLAEQQPNELRLRTLLLDVAFHNNDEAAMRRLLDEIRRIEGGSGTMWRFGEARWLLWRARRGEKQLLAEAAAHLDAVAAERPAWGAVLLCRAELNELQERPDQAIASYKQALALGMRHPYGVRRLAELLRERNRAAEATQVFVQLAQEDAIPAELRRLAAEVAVQANDAAHALPWTELAVPANAGAYQDQLWRGQMLWALDKRAQAEQAFRQANAQGRTEPETWVALVQCLMRSDRKEQAVAAIQDAQRVLPPERAPLALAQCYELVEDLPRARAQYQAAQKANPDDVRTLQTVAEFELRAGPVSEAVELLQQLIVTQAKTAPETVAWARRSLAVVQASRGDYPSFLKALELLDQNRPAEAAADQRARAVVLATQKSRRLPGEADSCRRQAILLLEQLVQRQQATPADRFLLAQLYDSDGDWSRFQAGILPLLSLPNPNPQHIAHYVRRLLRQRTATEALRTAQLRDAQAWAETLKKNDPSALQTLEILVRVQHAQGHSDEVVRLLRPLVEKDEAASAAVRLGFVAGLLDDLTQLSPQPLTPAAEKLFRTCAEQRPEEIQRYVGYLSRQQRVGEALTLCEQAWKKCPTALAASISVTALRGCPVSADDSRRVEEWLTEALRKNPEAQFTLLAQLADLRDIQGRYPEAITLYRQILERDPRNLVALNNLAWLLSLRDGNHREALERINQAIDLVGPLGELLDTRAVVHLGMKQPVKANEDFQEALRESPTASRYLFHLAQAQRLANNPEAARTAFQQARTAGLDVKDLHPLERPAYQQLLTEFKLH